MESTTITALATLGGAFGGAIVAEIFAYELKLKRKRIDFLFKEVDKLNDNIEDVLKIIPKMILEIPDKLKTIPVRDQEIFLKEQDIYFRSLWLKIRRSVFNVMVRPEATYFCKKCKNKSDIFVRRRVIWSKNKRKQIAKSINSLLQIKIDFKVLKPGEAAPLVNIKVADIQKAVSDVYLSFK